MIDSVRHGAGVSEYITFRVGGQFFGIDIMRVREIRGWSQATKLPHAPAFVRGVINLRGAVLPVIDLAERLGFEPITASARNVVIVTSVGSKITGLLVDAVSDIISQEKNNIQPTPDVATDLAKSFISGVFAIEDRMIGVIELDHVIPTVVGVAA